MRTNVILEGFQRAANKNLDLPIQARQGCGVYEGSSMRPFGEGTNTTSTPACSMPSSW